MSTKSESRRLLRQERQQSGLCIHCGLEPASELRGCERCLAFKCAAQKRYVAKTPERNRLYFLKIRKEVTEKYGGVCACCGEPRFEFLTIDHVNNDGGVERKADQKAQGRSWFLRLRREARRPDLQVLCWNCNLAKLHFGECPHKSGVEVDFTPLSRDGRRDGNFGVGEKIKWPSDDELVGMVRVTNCSAVAKVLGVHNTAVRSRLKRRGLYEAIKVQHEQQEKDGAASVQGLCLCA